MIIRRSFVISAAIIMVLFSIGTRSDWWPFSNNNNSTSPQAEVTKLSWDDLIPDDFVQPKNPFSTMSQEAIDKLMDGSEESNAEVARLKEEFNYAPVVQQLDGQRIKIPAYITPLEFNGQSQIKEFLLVPYLGACMHTPPPPSNQIVHAKSPEAIKIPSMYEPVWAIGTIRTESVKSELAESGYRLEVEEVLPYVQQ
ncbi:MAG: DUF3299 domain-containing protein [Aestuariibacter sp.]|nr:DUF3299 domain-containing protein [Aestuariibacter sp.]